MGNALFRDHAMKLGVMAFNCSHGSTVTNVDEAWEMTWDDNATLARMVDEAGMEAVLPVGRWKGYGGESNFNNRTFESFTWASAIAAITRQCTVFATIHAPLIHPLVAAKMAATVDHVSGGRFALNLVAGWFEDEFVMFGHQVAPHEDRYAYAAEWVELVKRAWTEENEFDHGGQFFSGTGIWSQPKPRQQPRPPIMNAGSSATGQAFSATHADMNFVMLRQKSVAEDTAQITQLKTLAADRGRSSQCWIHGYVVCRDTQKEAEDYLHHYVVEKGDDVAAGNMLRIFGLQSATLDAEVMEAFKFHFKAGFGAYPLVGTPEKIVADMARLSSMGVDGILLSWVDYLGECRQWIDQVMPLMVQVGLRREGLG